MKKCLLFVCAIVLVGCTHSNPNPPEVGVDPLLTWGVVNTDCSGTTITGVRYNVYAVQGTGPVPTVPSANEAPCGVVQLASGTPLNSTPITSGTSFQAIVPNGVWSFAIEAVASDGVRGEISNSVTKTVQGRPGKVSGVTVTLNADGTFTVSVQEG